MRIDQRKVRELLEIDSGGIPATQQGEVLGMIAGLNAGAAQRIY
jgi:hypothetical protein